MEEQATKLMGTLEILGLMCGAGAFGGILDVLQLIDIRKLVEQSSPVLLSKRRFLGALLLGGTGGMGGAIAMLFIIVATAKLDTNNTPTNRLLLVSLGMVSGFLGYRVLRSVAQRVERQIQEVEERTEKRIIQATTRVEEQTTKKIVESKITLQREVEYSDAITTGKIVEADKTALPSSNEEAIYKLKRVLEEIPDDRQATIILANLYAKIGDYNESIRILSDFITLLESNSSGRNKDIADTLYNRACMYNVVVNGITDDLTKKRELKHKVYADLERSFRLSPKNKEEVVNDPDLKDLLNEELFRPLLVQ